MDKTILGKFIAEQRKTKNLTQKQFAEKLNVTDKAVSKWETGKGYPDIEMFEKISEVLDVSVSELLEGKQISKEDIFVVSETQIVNQIKTNKRNKKTYRIIISVILIIAMVCGYFALRESGVLDGVIYSEIDYYSNEISVILSCVEGYISQRPKAEGDFIINNGYFFIEEDKTTNNLYLSGTCENGRYFYINTLGDTSDGYCFIGEMRENTKKYEGITINGLKQLVAQLDLSSYETADNYHITIHYVQNYENLNLYKNVNRSSIDKYIFSDGVLQLYQEQYLNGEYLLILLQTAANGSGTTVAEIFCEIT